MWWRNFPPAAAVRPGSAAPARVDCGSGPLAQEDVGRAVARDVLRAFIAQGAHVDVVQEMLAETEQDGPDGEMQLVDQGGAEILADSGDAAAEADVAGARCSPCLLQRGVDTFRDEAKLRSSVHPEWRPRMMRQHEDGRVVWRLVAPPAPPPFVRPRAPGRTEHFSPPKPLPPSREA